MKRTHLKLTLIATVLLTATSTFAASDSVLCPQIVTSALQYDQKDSTTDLQAFNYLGGYIAVNGVSSKTAAEALIDKVTGPYSPTATSVPLFPMVNEYMCVYAPYGHDILNKPSIVWMN